MIAHYRKAWVAACVSALGGASASAGLLLYDWAPDGHIEASALRWAGGALLLGLLNGVLSAYGVAVVPNAPMPPLYTSPPRSNHVTEVPSSTRPPTSRP